MAQLSILRYPDPRLHTVARPVVQVDERIRRLVDDMLETMYAAEGVGLEVDANMVNNPRTNPYIRLDGWDDEVDRLKAKAE